MYTSHEGWAYDFIMTFAYHLPEGKKVNSSRWIFTNKSDGLSNVIKHKVIFVAKGFSQKFGIELIIS